MTVRAATSERIVFAPDLIVATPDIEDGDTLLIGIGVINTYDSSVITPPDTTGWGESPVLVVQYESNVPTSGGYLYSIKITDASSAPTDLHFTTTDSSITWMTAVSYFDVGTIADFSFDSNFGFTATALSVNAPDAGCELVAVYVTDVTGVPAGMTSVDADNVGTGSNVWFFDEFVAIAGATGDRSVSIIGGGWVAFLVVFNLGASEIMDALLQGSATLLG